MTPDRSFDRAWALTLLARTLDRLRDEYHATGRPAFDALSPVLTEGSLAVPYATVAG